MLVTKYEFWINDSYELVCFVLARPVYSETQINDSNESIHFGEPKPYCSTGVVWFRNIYGSLYSFSESAWPVWSES